VREKHNGSVKIVTYNLASARTPIQAFKFDRFTLALLVSVCKQRVPLQQDRSPAQFTKDGGVWKRN